MAPSSSQDPPRTLQENLLEPPGADLGPNLSQLGANLGPTWANLSPTWANLRQHKANLRQHKAILRQLEANLSQLEANLSQNEANLSQLEPTLNPNLVIPKNVEKPMVFIGFLRFWQLQVASRIDLEAVLSLLEANSKPT